MTPEKPSQVENLNPNVSLSHRNNSLQIPLNNKNINPIDDEDDDAGVKVVAAIVPSPQNRIRQRKFVVAKKNNNEKNPNKKKTVSCKCKDSGGTKCVVCEAYQNLRASQEEFFSKEKNFDDDNDKEEDEKSEEEKAESVLSDVIEARLMIHDIGNEGEGEEEKEEEGCDLECSSMVKRRRERVLEEARNSVPESGSGRVMHLVKAFERLLSIPKKDQKNEENDDEKKNKVMKWALPGLQLPQQPSTREPSETDTVSGSESLFCCNSSELVLTSENLGLDKRMMVSVSSSWDSSRGRFLLSFSFDFVDFDLTPQKACFILFDFMSLIVSTTTYFA